MALELNGTLGVIGSLLSAYVLKTTTYSVILGDKGTLIDTTGTWTLSLLAAATATAGFNFGVRNSGTGVITIDPNSTELIDGATSIDLSAGESLILCSSGSAWFSVGKSAGTPSGILTPFAGTTAPSGWLICDGLAISRTTYASLFGVISTNYGVGDGSTTFNIPDLRGRVPLGKDNMGGTAVGRVTNAEVGIAATVLGATGGAQSVTLTAAQSGLPSHSHSYTAAGSYGGYPEGGGSGAIPSGSTTGATGGTAASNSHSSVQPSIVTNYIIKA